LNNNPIELVSSNTLVDGDILQEEWWGACLWSTILFQWLLESGLEIISRKSHNIYYENIYGIERIWLDATIFRDDTYLIDLIFKNNTAENILILKQDSTENIGVEIYWKTALKSTITPVNIDDIGNINWSYEIYLDDTLQSQKNFISSYSVIDEF
jgi:vancomycin resistance protein YoaR